MTSREPVFRPAPTPQVPAKPKSPFVPQEDQLVQLEQKDPRFPKSIKTLLFKAIQERKETCKGKSADTPIGAPGDAAVLLLDTCAVRGAGAWMTLAELCTQYVVAAPGVAMGQAAADVYMEESTAIHDLRQGALHACECVALWMVKGPGHVGGLLRTLNPAMVQRVARVQLAETLLLAARSTPQDVVILYRTICPEDWQDEEEE